MHICQIISWWRLLIVGNGKDKKRKERKERSPTSKNKQTKNRESWDQYIVFTLWRKEIIGWNVICAALAMDIFQSWQWCANSWAPGVIEVWMWRLYGKGAIWCFDPFMFWERCSGNCDFTQCFVLGNHGQWSLSPTVHRITESNIVKFDYTTTKWNLNIWRQEGKAKLVTTSGWRVKRYGSQCGID